MAKKPVNIEAIENAQKPPRPAACGGIRGLLDDRYGPKLSWLSWRENEDRFSGRNTGICHCNATMAVPGVSSPGDHATVSDFLCR
jgi:hypothetical protein